MTRLLSTRLLASDSTVLNRHAYGYNAANQRTQQVFTAGNCIDYGYDGAGQLVNAKGRESGGTTNRLQEQMGYYYDAAGNLNRRTNNALVQTFNVNSLNALTTVTRTGTFTVGGATTTRATNVTVNGLSAVLYRDLSFASAGHTLADGDNTFTAIARSSAGDAATNSVSAYLPATTTFAYDGNGNLTNDGRRVFFYDDENQLVRVVVTDGSGGSTRSDFVYDGKMRRRARIECAWSGGIWVTNRIVRYVYDGNLVLEERWFTPSVSANAVQQQVTYTRGRDLSGTLEGAGGIGGLLARTSYATTSSQRATSYYHCDGNGNVTCLVSSNQLIVASYAYDPFGTVSRQSGPMAESNLYRFSSKEWHENSGLVYYLYRFYDPGLQRWLNRDPLGDAGSLVHGLWAVRTSYDASPLQPLANLSLTTFVNNDPLSRIDLNGLIDPCDAIKDIVVGAGAGAGAGVGYAAGRWVGGVVGGILGAGAGPGAVFVGPAAAAGGSVIGGRAGAWIGGVIGTGLGNILGQYLAEACRCKAKSSLPPPPPPPAPSGPTNSPGPFPLWV